MYNVTQSIVKPNIGDGDRTRICQSHLTGGVGGRYLKRI